MTRTLTLLATAFAALALVAPPAAAQLVETPEVEWTGDRAKPLRDKAAELGSPVAIYEFVRNETEFGAYHGSRSGSLNSFLGRRGNDVDLASVLVAMLRSQGIPARYAVGTIQVPLQDLQDWLGVRNPSLAMNILNSQGVPDVQNAPGGSAVELEHVWVEALVAYDQYRGAGSDAEIDCAGDPTPCQWVSLDPSFKLQAFDPGIVDLDGAVSFDYTRYYEAILNDDEAYQDKNPREIHEEEVLAHLRDQDLGESLDAVAWQGTIVPDRSGLLPASLPYEQVGSVRRYDSVAAHDAAENPDWAKRLRLTVGAQDQNGQLDTGQLFVDEQELLLAELTTQRLVVAFSDCGASCVQLDLNLAGTPVVEVPLGSLDYGDPLVFELEIDTGRPAKPIAATYPNLVTGGYFLIGTGGQNSNWSQVHRAAAQLLDANQQYPVINVGDVPHVDENGNGTIDAGEEPLLDNREAMDALTGGLLYTAMSMYYARGREAVERLDALNHMITPIEGFVGVVSSVQEVEYLDETLFSVMPAGLLIDMKGQRVLGSYSVESDELSPDNDHFELVGHVFSALEHEIWQEITGFDAFSTVRGIQIALSDGAQLLNPKKNDSADTLQGLYPAFGFQGQAPAPWVRHDIPDLFGTEPTTWSRGDGSSGSFHVFQSVVDGSTPAYRVNVATYAHDNGHHDNVFECFELGENELLSLIAQYGAQGLAPLDGLPSCLNAPPGSYGQPGTILDNLETAYFDAVDGQFSDFYDLFDRAEGFIPSAQQYRDADIGEEYHNAHLVASLRNNLYTPPNNQWVEYLIPSRKSDGETFRFVVYLRKQYDGNDVLESQTYAIQGEAFSAGGGYLDSSQALTFQNDLTVWDNEFLTDQNLVGLTNNDLFRTPSTADPVSTVTGNMYMDETDVQIKGRGLDLTFTRTYNSGEVEKAGSGHPLSPGWTHSYNMRLRANDYGRYPDDDSIPENSNGKTSSITYRDERGGEHSYVVDDGGASPTWAVSQPTGTFDDLQLDTPSAGYHTLRFRNGVRYVFEGPDLRTPGQAARLARVEDPYGNVLTLTYDASGRLENIDDNVSAAGRTGLSFTYHGDDRLETVSDWTGRTWTFGYDGAGNLTSVTNPLSETTTYEYEPGTSLLTGVAKPADRDGDESGGDVRTDFAYYEDGKTFMNANAQGVGETIDYDLYRKRTRVTGPRGYVRTHYYDGKGLLRKMEEPDGGLLFFEHSVDHLRTKKVDALGAVTHYSYQDDPSSLADPFDPDLASTSFGNVTLEEDALGNQTLREYDYSLFDRVTRIVDPRGNERRFEYYQTTGSGGVQGKLHRTFADVDGQSDVLLEEYTYTPTGRVETKKVYLDADDASEYRTTTWTYQDDDLNASEILVVGADGVESRTTFTYDGLGRIETRTRHRQDSVYGTTMIDLVTEYEYDALDRVVVEADPLGRERVTDYDANGKVTTITRRFPTDSEVVERVVQENVYDDADRLVERRDVFGNATHYEYDAGGNLLREVDPEGQTLRYEYDEEGRRSAAIDTNGHRVRTRYDLEGRPVQMVDPNGNATTRTYDALGRKLSEADALGNTRRFQYDENGNRTHVIAPRADQNPSFLNSFGATEYREYDELDRVTRIVDAADGETLFTWNLVGDRTSVTDAEGRTTTYTYDDLGRPTTVKDPMIQSPDQTVFRAFDQAGNRILEIDRKGQVTAWVYDELGRVTDVDYYASLGDFAGGPENALIEETYVYDEFGNLESAENGDVTYSYTYDEKNRLLTKKDSRLNRALRFTWDKADRMRTKKDYQNDLTEYIYDGSGRLVAERSSAYVQVSYHYDPAGRLVDRILSNGARTAYRYDDGNRLQSLAHYAADGSLVRETGYLRDRNGNPVVRQIGSETTIFGYDALDRLTDADFPGTADDRSYSYDDVGNRETLTTSSGVLHYLHDAGNRLQEIRQGSDTGPLQASFQYDGNGNMTSRLDGSGQPVLTLSYDPKDQLATAEPAAGPENTFAYDPDGYRIEKEDSLGKSRYFLQGEHVEAVYGASNGQKRATWFRGAVIDEIVNGYVYDGAEAANLTYHHDPLSSVVALTGHTGSVEEDIRYGPFGQVIATTGGTDNLLRYTGRDVDPDTGLYYYRARYYDPALGRFLSEDPLGFEGGVNFYAYVKNNPLIGNDPMGQDVVYVGGQVGGSSGGAGGSGQVAIGFDLEGHFWNPFDYYVIETAAAGGQTNIASYAGVGVIGYSTVDDPMDLAGASGLVGGSGGPPNPAPFGPAPIAGVDVARGSNYTSIELSGGIGGSVVMPVELHGMAAISSVQNAGEMVVDTVGDLANSAIEFFSSGSSGSSAGDGFVPYPSTPNLNQAENVYRK